MRLDVRIAVALVDRDGFKVVDAAELNLRRLDVDQVRDAVRRVEPVGRCDLAAARQDGEGVVGDVRFGQAGAQGEGRRDDSSRVGWPMTCWMRTSAMPAICFRRAVSLLA